MRKTHIGGINLDGFDLQNALFGLVIFHDRCWSNQCFFLDPSNWSSLNKWFHRHLEAFAGTFYAPKFVEKVMQSDPA